jgi:hypothetical protein
MRDDNGFNTIAQIGDIRGHPLDPFVRSRLTHRFEQYENAWKQAAWICRSTNTLHRVGVAVDIGDDSRGLTHRIGSRRTLFRAEDLAARELRGSRTYRVIDPKACVRGVIGA